MNVLMVTTAFPRHADDSEGTFVYGLARALHSHGAGVIVLAMHMAGAPTMEIWEGIEIHRPVYWRPQRFEALRREPGGLPVSAMLHPARLIQVPVFCAVHVMGCFELANRVDILHAHWTLSALCAQPASRLFRKPLVATVQGSDLLQASYGTVGAATAALALRHCDMVSALSRRLADRAEALGVPRSKLEVIPNGVDVKWFSPPNQETTEPVVLYVGSLIKRKGVHFLIGAAPAVVAALPAARFVIVGDGPERRALENLSAAIGLSHKVQFLGTQPPSQVRDLMRKAAVLVLPSIQEGFGVVLVEAMACGTPVVASDVDGIRDIVRPDSGLLARPQDSASLGQALISLLTDEPRRSRMGMAARERAVRMYSWDKVSATFLSHYSQLIAHSGMGGA